MGQERHNTSREGSGNQESHGVFLCTYCRSDTYEDVVQAALWGAGGLIAVEDIPVRVCQGCGEQFYDDETARKIEKLLADPPAESKQQIRVPVFSLADVEVPRRGSRPEVVDPQEMEAIESTFTGIEPGEQEPGEAEESRQALRCKYCQSDTREEVVNSALWADRGWVAVEDIPARVCRQCGEQFYEDETARKIDKLIEHGFPAAMANREILVPVFSLAEIEGLEGRGP